MAAARRFQCVISREGLEPVSLYTSHDQTPNRLTSSPLEQGELPGPGPCTITFERDAPVPPPGAELLLSRDGHWWRVFIMTTAENGEPCQAEILAGPMERARSAGTSPPNAVRTSCGSNIGRASLMLNPTMAV